MKEYKVLHGPLWVVIYPWTYETDEITRMLTQIDPIKSVVSACKNEQN